MLLIFKNIAETTLLADIEEHLRSHLPGGLLNKTGRIVNIRIQLHKIGEKKEYHTLVCVEPDVVAGRIIKRLNRKPLRGKPINIAEFHFRHFSNDRRQGRYRPVHDRRKAERKTPKIDYELLGLRTE